MYIYVTPQTIVRVIVPPDVLVIFGIFHYIRSKAPIQSPHPFISLIFMIPRCLISAFGCHRFTESVGRALYRSSKFLFHNTLHTCVSRLQTPRCRTQYSTWRKKKNNRPLIDYHASLLESIRRCVLSPEI